MRSNTHTLVGSILGIKKRRAPPAVRLSEMLLEMLDNVFTQLRIRVPAH